MVKKVSAQPSSKANANNKNNQNKKQKGYVYAPTAQSRTMRTSVPVVSGSPYQGDGMTRIRHREYIAEISGTSATDFTSVSFGINPGLSSTFTWLSQIASNYESFKFRSLSFEFETERPTSDAGSVMMAVDFDAADSAPTSKAEMMAFHNAVRTAPWADCCYQCDTKDLLKFGVQRYNRPGSIAANLDIKTYDVGNLIVAVQGNSTASLGELYVTYDVELHTPQINNSNALAAIILGTSSITRALPFGDAPTITGNYPCAIAKVSGNKITFNRIGTYILSDSFAGTVCTANDPTNTPVNCVMTVLSLSSVTGGAPGAGTGQVGCYQVVVTAVGATLILAYAPSCTTLTAHTLRISQYAPGLN